MNLMVLYVTCGNINFMCLVITTRRESCSLVISYLSHAILKCIVNEKIEYISMIQRATHDTHYASSTCIHENLNIDF